MSELEQRIFDDGPSFEIDVPGEAHLACVLLLDTSCSMIGEPINNLNKALRDFKEQVQADEMSARRIDVAIIEFNSDVRVVQDFVPISRMEPITLTATGCTSMGAGIELAIKKLKERNLVYANAGTPVYQPWIVMITDGAPTDDITTAAQLIKAEEAKGTNGKLKFWTAGVPGFSLEYVAKLSDTKRIMKLESDNFENFFKWVGGSISTISVSRVDEKVKLEDLPGDVVPVKKNELPPEW